MSASTSRGQVRGRTRALARRHLSALCVYVLAGLAFTWPLATQFTTHVTGDGIDDPALAWNLWWIFARLVEQHQPDIFHVDWMFHPIEINLAFYTLTPLNGLLSVPLQGSVSLIVANNLLLLSSFVFGAYGAFLLVFYLLGISSSSERGVHTAAWVALVAGLVYGFASSKLFYASLGQFNIASSQWIPFAVLYLLRMTGLFAPRSGLGRTWNGRAHDVVLAALFLSLQAYAELTYASFLIVFAGLLFGWSVIVHMPRGGFRALLPLVGRFAALGLLFLLAIGPVLGAMLPDMQTEGDFFSSGGGFADVFSADLFGYLMPTRLHPLLGDWVAAQPFPNDKGQHIFLGLAVTLVGILGLIALFRRRGQRAEAWFWLGATLFFWWLTLGPTVRWRGADTGILGPFAVISQLPFFSGNRYPSRYSVMLMLCAAVLVGYGLRWILEGSRPRRARVSVAVLGSFAAVFAFEHVAAPLPLNDFRTPAIYDRVAAQPGDGTVLELPTGWRNGARVLGKSDVLIMMQQWYQTTHGKRRLGGNTSRNPPYKFQYFTEAPLVGDLIALMNSDDPRLAAYLEADWDALVARNADAAQVLDFLGVDSVLLHVDRAPALLQRFVEDVLPLEPMDTWQGDNWQGELSEIRLYAVQTPTSTWSEIDLGAPEATLHLAEGWSAMAADGGIRYATRPQAALLLDLPSQAHTLELTVSSISDAVGVTVNGQRIGTYVPRDGSLSVPIPAGAGAALVDRVELAFGGAPIALTELAQSSTAEGRAIGGTGVTLAPAVSILVRSAGEEVGDFAALFVNGVDYSLNQRGYNLVALTPDGTHLGGATFDTFAGVAQSQAMAAWIQQWPLGTVIAGAVADEASMSLEDTALRALESLGVAGDLRDRFRWSHGFVGAVGAPVGTAVEDMQLIRPAGAYVGIPVDATQVYGGVERIRLHPAR